MRIGIIGATGMIGHHTARAVIARGHELVVIHRQSSNIATLNDLTFTSAVGDLNDVQALPHALADLDAVINCAAYYPTKPLPWKAEVATALTQMNNFFDACAQVHLKKIVYLGAAIALQSDPQGLPGTEDLVYPGQPPEKIPYIQVKWAMDHLAEQRAKKGLPVVIAIPTMCFGEFDYGPTTGRLVVDIANGELPAYIKGKRNVIYTGDAGRGLVLACESGTPGERYLFTGTNITMNDLVALIANVAGVPAPKRVVPLALAKTVSRMQETRYRLFGGEVPRFSATAIAIMASGQFLSGSKAERELGFRREVDLNETVTRAFRWFSQNGYVKRNR